jgi:hypothetical protein
VLSIETNALKFSIAITWQQRTRQITVIEGLDGFHSNWRLKVKLRWLNGPDGLQHR